MGSRGPKGRENIFELSGIVMGVCSQARIYSVFEYQYTSEAASHRDCSEICLVLGPLHCYRAPQLDHLEEYNKYDTHDYSVKASQSNQRGSRPSADNNTASAEAHRVHPCENR
jgi:hypothetical protein